MKYVQCEKLKAALHKPDTDVDFTADILTLKCREQAVSIGKEPICKNRRPQFEQIQDVNIHVCRHMAGDQLRQNRKQRQSRRSNRAADDSIIPPVKTHQRADLSVIIIGYGAVHAVYHSRVYTQLSDIQRSYNRGKQSAQSEVFHTQLMKHRRAHHERHQNGKQLQ